MLRFDDKIIKVELAWVGGSKEEKEEFYFIFRFYGREFSYYCIGR